MLGRMSAVRTAVVFDLDGTLVDSEPNYYEAGRRTLAAYGVADFGWQRHTDFIGIGTRETLETLGGRKGRAGRGGRIVRSRGDHSLGQRGPFRIGGPRRTREPREGARMGGGRRDGVGVAAGGVGHARAGRVAAGGDRAGCGGAAAD